MQTRILAAGLALGSLSAFVCGWSARAATSAAPSVDVAFSPGRACTEAAVALVDGARHEVLVDAYGFTNHDVIDALKRARARDVAVGLVLDRSNRGKEAPAELRAAGAAVWIDAREPIHHAKVLVADGAIVFAGSWNLTKQAERNDEDCLTIRDDGVARRYAENWELHRAHAEELR